MVLIAAAKTMPPQLGPGPNALVASITRHISGLFSRGQATLLATLSVCQSIRPSVRPSVRPSMGHTRPRQYRNPALLVFLKTYVKFYYSFSYLWLRL